MLADQAEVALCHIGRECEEDRAHDQAAQDNEEEAGGRGDAR